MITLEKTAAPIEISENKVVAGIDKSEDNARLAKEKQHKLVEELIQLKKSRTETSLRLKPLFFGIGLVTALLISITAFEWRSFDDQSLMDLGVGQDNLEELLDIPLTEQPPPPPPSKSIQQPNIVEVKDVEELLEEIEIDFDVEITEESVNDELEVLELPKPEEEVAEEIFTIVEQLPEPYGGMEEFFKYLYDNIEYPEDALKAKLGGRVFIQFIVNKDGSLTDFVVLKGIGMGCDEEAVRVLKSSPKWKAGKQRGKAVKVQKVIPVIFKYKERW